MKRLLFFFTISLTFLTTIIAKGNDPKKDIQKNAKRDSLINVLIKSSRIEEQISSMSESFDKFNRLPEINPEISKEISRVLTDSFNPDTILSIIKQSFRKNYDERNLLLVLQSLNTPLMQKIYSLENKKFDSLSVEELQGMAARLPRSGRMINMVRELCKVSKIVDITDELNVKFLKSFIPAINLKLPKDKQIGGADFNSFIKNFSINLKPQIQMGMELVIYYRYKDLNYQELQEYINSYSTNYGFWFNQTLKDGMVKAFDYCGIKLTRQIQESDIIKLSNK